MKRRNFLSGFLAVPLALKARFFAPLKARFFAPKPRMRQLTPEQRRVVELLAEGKPIRGLMGILRPVSMKQWAEKAVGRRGAWLN